MSIQKITDFIVEVNKLKIWEDYTSFRPVFADSCFVSKSTEECSIVSCVPRRLRIYNGTNKRIWLTLK